MPARAYLGCLKQTLADRLPRSALSGSCSSALEQRLLPVFLSAHERSLVGIWGGACCLQVTKAVQALQQREGWEGLPLYGLGISSGGAMVLFLAHRLEMQVGACSHGSQACLGPPAGSHAGGGMQP